MTYLQSQDYEKRFRELGSRRNANSISMPEMQHDFAWRRVDRWETRPMPRLYHGSTDSRAVHYQLPIQFGSTRESDRNGSDGLQGGEGIVPLLPRPWR